MSSIQNGSSCGIGDYRMTKHRVSLESGNYSIKVCRHRLLVRLEFTNLLQGQQNGNLASYDFEAFSRRVCPQEPERTAGLRYSLSDSSEIWVGAAALLPSTIFNRVTYPTTRFLSRLVFASTRSARTVLLDS